MRYLPAASPRTLLRNSLPGACTTALLRQGNISSPYADLAKSCEWQSANQLRLRLPLDPQEPPAPGYACTGCRESPHAERRCLCAHKPNLALPELKTGSMGPVPMLRARRECSAWDNMSPSLTSTQAHHGTDTTLHRWAGGGRGPAGWKCQQKDSRLSTPNSIDWF